MSHEDKHNTPQQHTLLKWDASTMYMYMYMYMYNMYMHFMYKQLYW